MDKTTARSVGERAVAALQKEFGPGWRIERGRGKFTSGSLDLSITFIEPNGASKEEEYFKQYARLVGLKPEDFGRTFRFDDDVFTITGFRPRASRRPIMAQNRNGREYVFGADTVKRLLEAS